MNSDRGPHRALLWLTFLESFGTVLLERALYFYTHDILGFSDLQNLWLAFAFGVTYVGGALASHAAALRFGEKRLLVGSLVILLAVHLALAGWPRPLALVLAFPLIGFLQGIKWPVVESYVSAGRTPGELVRVLGRYNSTWALSVPLAMVAAGPLIATGYAGLLFGVAAALNVAAVALARPLAEHPAHLDHAHPERPGPAELSRLTALLASARWCMLLSYALLFLLAPLMPTVLARFELGVSAATSAAGLPDLARFVCFLALGTFTAWRGRALPLVLSIVFLPVSFAMTLFGSSLEIVLIGEIMYGLTAGFAYMAALYYALLVKNASVDAGGAHEGLIGLGFALGPLAGIIAHSAAGALGSSVLALLLSVAPLALLCTVAGIRPLRPSS